MSGVSNPELQERLNRFREIVVMPQHLSEAQKKLVYTKQSASYLESESITAVIAGEKFRLKYIDKLRDLPRLKLFVYDILPLMKDKEDWRVLPNVLQGLKNAGIKLKVPLAEKLVRIACLNGQMNIILECLRRTNDTGMELSNIKFTKTLLYWICFKAYEQDKTIDCVIKSLTMAEQVLEMLQDIKYTGKSFDSSKLRYEPEIFGLLLSVTACKATKFKYCDDRDGLVARYASKFVQKSVFTPPQSSTPHTIKQAQNLKQLEILVSELNEAKKTDESSVATKRLNREKRSIRSELGEWLLWIKINSLIVKGIKLALTVLDSSFQQKQALQERVEKLKESVNSMESAWQEVDALRGKVT